MNTTENEEMVTVNPQINTLEALIDYLAGVKCVYVEGKHGRKTISQKMFVKRYWTSLGIILSPDEDTLAAVHEPYTNLKGCILIPWYYCWKPYFRPDRVHLGKLVLLYIEECDPAVRSEGEAEEKRWQDKMNLSVPNIGSPAQNREAWRHVTEKCQINCSLPSLIERLQRTPFVTVSGTHEGIEYNREWAWITSDSWHIFINFSINFSGPRALTLRIPSRKKIEWSAEAFVISGLKCEYDNTEADPDEISHIKTAD